MPVDLSDNEIKDLLDLPDFVRSCDEAFRLCCVGDLVNFPREESVTQTDGDEVFRLILAGEWKGRLLGRKVIVEESEVSTGRLGERSATLEVTLTDSGRTLTLDAELITNRRTGAAAALGAKYLAKVDSRVVGIVGTGRVAMNAAMAIEHLIAPSEIRVTSRKAENRQAFVDEVGPGVEAEVLAVSSIEEAVGEADVVITAVPTPKPILDASMLKPDAHLSVVAGDPRTVQLDVNILIDRPVVVDEPSQARKSGDFVEYEDQVGGFNLIQYDGREATIGDAALDRLAEHRGTGCVTYFTGMAVQDLHAAYAVLTAAGLGT